MVFTLTLTGIHRFPVKSCRGEVLEDAALDARGLTYDRRWMIVDDAGRFLTQRTHPHMALVTARITEDALVLGAPGLDDLVIPHDRPPRTLRDVTVWRDVCRAEDEGDAAASWLERALGVPCRLVRAGAGFRRSVDDGAERVAGAEIAFADGFPLLLASTASLDDLNSRLDLPVEMVRFRPNFVVSGCGAFAEDTWRRIRIGSMVFVVARACERCTIPAVDPATGERGPEPLVTLASYRRAEDGKIRFGQNLIHEVERGTIRVGDPIEILEAGPVRSGEEPAK